ncbi:MAG TPA: hypothetical protein VH877_00400 [Polyangia bacterium]|nr:hypothetical protein [Polyangia bacterium]
MNTTTYSDLVTSIGTTQLPDGRIQLWGISTANALWTTWMDTTAADSGWAPWFPFPQPPWRTPQSIASVLLSDGRPQVFLVAGSALYTCSKPSTDPSASWSAWSLFPTDQPLSQVATWNYSTGKAALFALTSAGQAITCWQKKGDPTQWSPWSQLPGNQSLQKIVAATLPDGRAQLFGITQTGKLVSRMWTSTHPKDGWTDWSAFQGGPTVSDVAVAPLATGQLQVFTATSQGLQTCWMSSASTSSNWTRWSPFPNAGDVRQNPPPLTLAATTLQDQAVRLFLVDTTHQIQYTTTGGYASGWSDWTPMFPAGTSAQISAQSKFMQNYRIASPVHPGSQVIAAKNGSGAVELFTTASDGQIFNYYPDPASDTGYSGIATGLRSTPMAVGVQVDGALVVIAAPQAGTTLSYVTEQRAGGSRWSAPATVTVPTSASNANIAGLYTAEIAGQLYVAVLTGVAGSYSLAVSIWQPGRPSFTSVKGTIPTTNCVFVGNSAATAGFAVVDTSLTTYSIASGTHKSVPITSSLSPKHVDAANDGPGNTRIFALLSDGNAYQLVQTGSSYGYAALSTGMNFGQIGVGTDDAGNVNVFAVDANHQVFHFEPSASLDPGQAPQASAYGSPGVIAVSASSIALAANDQGALDLFVVGTGQLSLTHMYQEEASSNWVSESVEVQPANGGDVEDYISYSSDVLVLDADGVPLVNTPVYVWTPEQALLSINGGSYWVDQETVARLSTNSGGMLSISQETGSLAAPAIYVSVPSQMAPGASLTIDQTAAQQETLATVTASDLLQPLPSGRPLLPSPYDNQATAESLAAACNSCMTLPGTARATSGEQHWQIAFAPGRATYRRLTAAEAEELLTHKRATLEAAQGVLDWLSDIGDFISSVVDSVASVVDAVVTTVAAGVQAAITFIVDGVTYLFEVNVSAVEQAFDLVQTCFAQVQVFFEDLFEWLGFVFDWPDMLRTHQAFVYTANQFIGFLGGAVAGLQAFVDQNFEGIRTQVQNLFNTALQSIGGDPTVGGYEKAHQQPAPALSSAASNNIVYNGLLDNAQNGTTTATLPTASTAVQSATQTLQNMASTAAASQAFAQAQAYFTAFTASNDAMFTQLLSGMLSVVQGVALELLSGLQTAIDTILGVVADLIVTLQDVLNAPWNIPFVSQLYSSITGGTTLTTLDLLALIVAIPATVLYKLATHEAPFPTDDSVTAFEASFNSATMLQAAGLAGAAAERAVLAGTARDTTAWTGLVPPSASLLFAVGATVSQLFYSGLSCVLDILPPASPAPTAISWGVFTMEVLWQALTFPWFTSAGAVGFADANERGRVNWLWQIDGICLDAMSLTQFGSISENADDRGVLNAFFYAVIHTGFTIAACVGASTSSIIGNVLSLIPELAKIGRLKVIVDATEGISLGVVGACDILFGITSAGVNFLAALPSRPGPAPALVAAR